MFSMHVLAFGLSVPLLALAAPTASSQFQLPPDLDPKILKLVRAHAIDISTHRSVYAPASSFPKVSP
jgi:hypothetical protein